MNELKECVKFTDLSLNKTTISQDSIECDLVNGAGILEDGECSCNTGYYKSNIRECLKCFENCKILFLESGLSKFVGWGVKRSKIYN